MGCGLRAATGRHTDVYPVMLEWCRAAAGHASVAGIDDPQGCTAPLAIRHPHRAAGLLCLDMMVQALLQPTMADKGTLYHHYQASTAR